MDKTDGRVISNFVNRLKNIDITIYGDGSQTRSFCYISDQIRGLYLMNNFIGPLTWVILTKLLLRKLLRKL